MKEDGKENKISIWIAISAVLATGVAEAVTCFHPPDHSANNEPDLVYEEKVMQTLRKNPRPYVVSGLGFQVNSETVKVLFGT
ncbi:hypothetical protein AKJ51_00935 [candidate division MSBL1 archaeon SCGC-AAA382A20]|uniref:Uncharacterized protein n=1 Tax=candidate division MSBL1 archaeon SCGC-AAA382A20 TaxID=1698280 RepID=A0A133VMH4_9EURY|nr:hypothetical protein AKJ51_00935 [candidate division MSBL1 archaeon SCGC-AAA382A20]